MRSVDDNPLSNIGMCKSRAMGRGKPVLSVGQHLVSVEGGGHGSHPPVAMKPSRTGGQSHSVPRLSCLRVQIQTDN